MHPNFDSPTVCRQTIGNKPGERIGASITVIKSKVYLFGGRLVSEPTVVSDLFIYDLETCTWEEVLFRSQDFGPPARFFHSADAWNERLVIFGGSRTSKHPYSADLTRLLNDVQIFDTTSRRWLPSHEFNDLHPLDSTPTPRHSHLSSVVGNHLYVIGGVGSSDALQDVHVYDLREKAWVEQYRYPRHLKSSFSVMAYADQYVSENSQGSGEPSSLGNSSYSLVNPEEYLDHCFKLLPPTPSSTPMSTSNSQLPYSTKVEDDSPCDVYVYSNEESTGVKRKFESFTPLPSAGFTVHDLTSGLDSNASPPLLQFPTGAVIGNHFIVSGTRSQNVEIWALDLLTLAWSPIDPRDDVTVGSWTQGCLWRDANKFIMFGDPNEDADDYMERMIKSDHVAIIDLESFGIYQPPPLALDLETQELRLFALEESVKADFEIICDDGQRIKCSRKRLVSQWPWFNTQFSRLLLKAEFSLETPPVSARNSRQFDESQPDPRIGPRSFNLAEQYEVTGALLRYFYTLSLPLQPPPSVLCRLLVLSATYEIPHLQSLVKHAMHLSLSEETCGAFYEAATKCDCQSLRFRCRALELSLSRQQKAAIRRPYSAHSGNTTEKTSQTSNRRSLGTQSLTTSDRPAPVGAHAPGLASAVSTEGADQLRPNPVTHRFANIRPSVFRWLLPSTGTTRRSGVRHHTLNRPPQEKVTTGKTRGWLRSGGSRHHFPSKQEDSTN